MALSRFLSFLLFILPAVVSLQIPGSPNAYDHIRSRHITGNERWLEVGFLVIVPDMWTTVNPVYQNWTDPVVFISLPNIPGSNYRDGTPAALRVNNTKLTYVDSQTKDFSFDAKSYSVNDSYCTTIEFYTPKQLMLPPVYVGWMVVEKGKFNVSHKGFIINTDLIVRVNNSDYNIGNHRKSFAQNGVCDGGKNCRFEHAEVSTLITIAQLQTTRYDRFLQLRGITRGRRFVTYILLPHDSLDPINYLIPLPGEDYAWMLFEDGLEVTCVENLVIETFKREINFIKSDLDYSNTFLVPPAVFGMVQTLIGRDSVALRAFDITTTSSSFITQEDRCTDNETIHENLEEAALLVIGRTTAGIIVCGAEYNDNFSPTQSPTTESPTSSPTISPTAVPTLSPTAVPSAVPTPVPTSVPTVTPSAAPTASPTNSPTLAPSPSPTATPSAIPTQAPTPAPSTAPSSNPTASPTSTPTDVPSHVPTTAAPSASPTATPTATPTQAPTPAPSTAPTSNPTASPTSTPTDAPSHVPTTAIPSVSPTPIPTAVPSEPPTNAPTPEPSASPSAVPTTAEPSPVPTTAPTAQPTVLPTAAPSTVPTSATPSVSPTFRPSAHPTSSSPTSNNDWCTDVILYDSFGDGWGKDVALHVWSANKTFDDAYLQYVCPNVIANGTTNDTCATARTGPYRFCTTHDDSIFYDIVVFNGPIKERWEIYWTVEHLGDGNSTNAMLFVGDYDTNMTATILTVDVWDPVDYYNQTCTRCKHPPKPKPTPKSGPSSSESESSSESGSSRASKSKPTPKSGPSSSESGSSSSNASSDTESYRMLRHSSSSDTESEYSVSSNYSTEDSSSEDRSRPKGKPHWPFPVTLFDTEGSGWFNSSDSWTNVPVYTCRDKTEWESSRRLPAALTGPEYVIETIDRLHDVRRNTICGDLLKEDCEERLPDAKYIFRVTGALSKWNTRNDALWHFCGKRGTMMEELEFKLVKGKCFPGRKITAHEICYGTRTAAFEGMLTVYGTSGADLTEYDSAVLESILAESVSSVVPNVDFVSLESWEVAASSMLITFTININPTSYKLDGLDQNVMETLAVEMTAASAKFISSGAFMSFMESSLNTLPLGSNDALESAYDVRIGDITFVDTGLKFDQKPKVESALSMSAGVDSSTAAAPYVLDSFNRNFVLLGAVICGIAIVGYAAIHALKMIRDIRYMGSELLPTESERDRTSTSIDISEREIVPNWN